MRLSAYIMILILITLPQFVAAEGAIDLQKFAARFIKAEDMAWQQGDFNALQAIEDPNITFHSLDIKGWEAHKQYIMNARQNFSGIQQEWHYLTGDGNLFALSYTAYAMVNNEKMQTDALMLFRIGNGRITDVWLNMNTASLHD